MDVYEQMAKCTGFLWDEGNVLKSWVNHRVTAAECEQIFFNCPLIVVEDLVHSQVEERLYALGQTDAGRLLLVVFTLRRNLIRVISARDMSKKERREYKAS
ncbi:hypothetical protein CLG94_06165 [Candidatus Methylomirabilis limnetica]|jgi:hypothetical protein|uniref:BrnT family toxin n=1 Tax=Candidatus Methylomirabilis limnetica TaxID=2033718 RepID=A0A2T4TYT2_9BACT|nr:BrnT family toxin [Candidatus Methylomirabilis limnetica]PTL36238.1 hypothetical protein CLG94_06165 [Candidatus Methylomirabilis limnetica]